MPMSPRTGPLGLFDREAVRLRQDRRHADRRLRRTIRAACSAPTAPSSPPNKDAMRRMAEANIEIHEYTAAHPDEVAQWYFDNLKPGGPRREDLTDDLGSLVYHNHPIGQALVDQIRHRRGGPEARQGAGALHRSRRHFAERSHRLTSRVKAQAVNDRAQRRLRMPCKRALRHLLIADSGRPCGPTGLSRPRLWAAAALVTDRAARCRAMGQRRSFRHAHGERRGWCSPSLSCSAPRLGRSGQRASPRTGHGSSPSACGSLYGN